MLVKAPDMLGNRLYISSITPIIFFETLSDASQKLTMGIEVLFCISYSYCDVSIS